ncbi:MAG: hypothetical protein MK132_13390 [Lentisphaerales bacterium]|nr:hypothetical protein [Lentisphaerales bacterium]
MYRLIFFIFFTTFTQAIEHTELLPQDCNALIGLDIDNIMKVPELKELLTDKNNDDLKELKSLGLSPENIISVLIGIDGNKAAADPEAFQKNPDILALIKLKSSINLTHIVNRARQENIAITKEFFNGIALKTLSKNNKKMTISELKKGVIAIGAKNLLKKAISLKTGTALKTVNDNSRLINLIPKKQMFWIAGTTPHFPPPGPNDPLSNPTASAAAQINAFTLSGNFNQILQLNAKLLCKTPQAAAQLGAMTQLMIGMTTANPDFPIKAENLKVSTNRENIEFDVKLDKTALRKIADIMAQNKTLLSPGF